MDEIKQIILDIMNISYEMLLGTEIIGGKIWNLKEVKQQRT